MADYNSKEWWNPQIVKAIEWRETCSKETVREKIRMYYQNRYPEAENMEPTFNLIFMIASSMIPSLVYQRPGIINTPRRPEFAFWAKFFDAVDGWLVDEMELKSVIQSAVLYAFLDNVCAIKVGYDVGEIKGQEMVFDDIPGVHDRVRKTNQPWLDVIPADRFIVAPGTKNTRNCRWYAEELTFPTESVKQFDGFKGVEATGAVSEKKRGKFENKWVNFLSKEEKWTTYWEIHEQEKGTISAIDRNGKQIMSPRPDIAQVDGLGMEILSFNQGLDGVWGTSDSEYILSQMIEGNESRRDGRLQRKNAVSKILVDSEVMTEEEEEQLTTGEPHTAIRIAVPPDKKLTDVATVFQPHVQLEFFEYDKKLIHDAQLITGMGPNQFGNFNPGRRTKGEAQIVEENSHLRIGFRREKVGDAISNLMSRVNQIVTKNWTAEVVQQVVGVEGALHWVKARPAELDNIRAQLTTRVNIESLRPVSSERRKSELVELLGVLSKFPEQQIDVSPIIQGFVSMFDSIEVGKVLPSAGPNVLEAQEFQKAQALAAQDPNLGQQLQQNLGGLGRLVNGLPQGGSK